MKYVLLKNLTILPVSKLDMHSLTITLPNNNIISIYDTINVDRKNVIETNLKIKLNSIVRHLESIIISIDSNSDIYSIVKQIEPYRYIFECKEERLIFTELFEYFSQLFSCVDLFIEYHYLNKKSKIQFLEQWQLYAKSVLNRSYIEFYFDYGFHYTLNKIFMKKIKGVSNGK